MRRSLLSLLIGAALLAGIPAQAFWQSRDSNYNVSVSAGSTYLGPGNVKASADAWISCSFAYSGAYAGGKACNVRRASDSTAQDINVLANGSFDTASYNTFVGTDATASCTVASTSAVCTGASATLHVNDPVTGTGLTQPCVVTATNGTTTATINIAGTATSCGTVSVAETFTFQVAGFVHTAYDQSGNTLDVTQTTNANQPQLLPQCLNAGTVPCIYTLRASSLSLSRASVTASAQPWTISAVTERVGSFTNTQSILSVGASTSNGILAWTSSANTMELYAGAAGAVGSISDGVLHAVEGIANNAVQSVLYIDGTSHNIAASTNTLGTTNLFIGTDNFSDASTAYIGEAGYWGLGFSVTDDKAMCTNKSTRYGMGLTCN